MKTRTPLRNRGGSVSLFTGRPDVFDPHAGNFRMPLWRHVNMYPTFCTNLFIVILPAVGYCLGETGKNCTSFDEFGDPFDDHSRFASTQPIPFFSISFFSKWYARQQNESLLIKQMNAVGYFNGIKLASV